MLSSGISSPSKLEHSKEDELPETFEPSLNSLSCLEKSCNSDHSLGWNGKRACCGLEENEEADSPKRSKIGNQESDGCSTMEATQCSMVDFIKGFDNGVSSLVPLPPIPFPFKRKFLQR